MRFNLRTACATNEDASPVILKLTNGTRVCLDPKEASASLAINGGHVYLFGDVFYLMDKDPNADRIVSIRDHAFLAGIFETMPLTDIVQRLEGQYIGIKADTKGKSITVFSDRFARQDVFFAQEGNELYLSADLDFIFKYVRPKHDQRMLAHMFSVYGWYTPKGTTIYSNVRRLKVGEILRLDEQGVHFESIAFEPCTIKPYTDDDLEKYYSALKKSVLSRLGTSPQTWLSCSSGWDSTSLLALLINELGAKNVRTITGVMKYSKVTDVINQFEVDKVAKIANFFGVKPEYVDYDFKDPKSADYWEKVIPYFRARQMYIFTSFSTTKLAQAVRDKQGPGQTIFNGEASDSFHNFGFSQFATLFHTDKNFTEYADKMNCYLFGPSFFKKVLTGTFAKDKVYQLFKMMNPTVEFDEKHVGRKDLVESFLLPFFYGSPRIPFAKTLNNPVLTPLANMAVRSYPYREYMPEVLESIDENNLYSWYCYLYHSLHAQGSSAATRRHAAEFNGHGWRSPFHDQRVVDLLAQAPEYWGRGLNFNHTKYPLKWMVINKIKFPFEILADGPHSYLYDVIEGFSLAAELVYRSGVTRYFKEKLRSNDYHALLSDQYFDMAYIDSFVDGYLNGKEVAGKDFNNLQTLITLCVTGWY